LMILKMPFNLPGPLVLGAASVLLLKFLFEVLLLAGGFFDEKVVNFFDGISTMSYIFVFLIVVALGYYRVFSD